MSDTPRTDALIEKHRDRRGVAKNIGALCQDLHDHADTLERELAQANRNADTFQIELTAAISAQENLRAVLLRIRDHVTPGVLPESIDRDLRSVVEKTPAT